MKDFDFILSHEQYEKLQREYNLTLSPNIELCVKHLNSIKHSLQVYGFKTSLEFQNQLLNQLNKAKQILNIAFESNQHTPLNLNNNPLKLLRELSILSSELTSHGIKSPYQTLFLKANSIVINCIISLCEYFLN